MRHLCGLEADGHTIRLQDQGNRLWRKRGSELRYATVMQPIRRVHDQRSFPSCAGQAVASAIDGQRNSVPSSGVSLWREGRRRAGLPLDDLSRGTTFVDVIDGLIARGWDPYRDGEDSDSEEAGKGAPKAGDDLADELFAHDTRHQVAERYRIWHASTERFCDLVDQALISGVGVVFGTGVKEPFFGLKPNELATYKHLGGNSNGHGMRIVGRTVAGSDRVYVVQNSWGEHWGGCQVDGLWYPGAFLCDAHTIATAWDAHVIDME